MAATFKSDGMPAEALVLVPLDAVKHGGKLHVDVCKYTATGAEVVGDAIELCKLPQGAKLFPHLCYVTGDQAATTAYLTGYTNTAGNALNAFSTFGANALHVDEDALTEASVLTATLVGGGLTAGKVLVFGIIYAQL